MYQQKGLLVFRLLYTAQNNRNLCKVSGFSSKMSAWNVLHEFVAGWKWAVLFSRQILNGSQDIFFSLILQFSFCFFKYETTIETHARAFLTLNILSLGTVRIFQTGISWIFFLNFKAPNNLSYIKKSTKDL